MKLFSIIMLSGFLIGISACQSVRDTLGVGAASKANPAPCPSAIILREAARLIDFNGEEKLKNIRFSGEIASIKTFCRYFENRPIRASLELEFGFGRGDAAEHFEHTYHYFIAVTRKNKTLLFKQIYPIHVRFSPEENIVNLKEHIKEIIIPRASKKTSGENFEIIVGFVVTPEQEEFNRLGKRFIIK